MPLSPVSDSAAPEAPRGRPAVEMHIAGLIEAQLVVMAKAEGK